jgi:hypothetical protein
MVQYGSLAVLTVKFEVSCAGGVVLDAGSGLTTPLYCSQTPPSARSILLLFFPLLKDPWIVWQQLWLSEWIAQLALSVTPS